MFDSNEDDYDDDDNDDNDDIDVDDDDDDDDDDHDGCGCGHGCGHGCLGGCVVASAAVAAAFSAAAAFFGDEITIHHDAYFSSGRSILSYSVFPTPAGLQQRHQELLLRSNSSIQIGSCVKPLFLLLSYNLSLRHPLQ